MNKYRKIDLFAMEIGSGLCEKDMLDDRAWKGGRLRTVRKDRALVSPGRPFTFHVLYG